MASRGKAHAPSTAAMELLQTLRDGNPRTRARLAELCGVARSTAGIRIDELIKHGYVEEEVDAIYTGGRPSSRVALRPRSRVVLAADIGASHARLALVDLLGRVLAETSTGVQIDDEPEKTMRWLVDESRSLAASVQIPVADIAAIGIGLAAPIEHSTGRPINPPIMPRWADFDSAAWLHKHYDIPVVVEKDVNMMAVGEHQARPKESGNLLFAKIATGIGVGIISGDRLHRGEQGIAGDIGHVPLRRDVDVPCHCGNRGCLEAVASGPALAAALRELGRDANTTSDVVDLVRSGDIEAIQLVRQAGRDMGEVLATCVSLFNPSLIVVGGTLSRAGDHLLAGVREVVYARSMPLATQRLEIAQSDPSTNSAVLGAAAMAVDRVLAIKR
ncbi:putative NBD/HSP70 family sugar kinase [Homoserinimonas aerilata]|uniref:Putative NBD/HSP70 family sugar kinase n=2 Tax=Homoserinimonas aerilata TaxID=1162970 RepID=A0A542YL85_9MICO|nr:ROK family transcriptional regulator [Homoserinimonas aerilata]TQL48850.1 putative NBD/HSP70 family sugar kinase [Homoserinimonas aerilata]